MKDIVFLEPNKIDSEPFTTSDVIAEFAGVKHHAMQVLIQKYETDLKEFGKVSFEMRAVKRSGERGIKYLKNYHLNEQQATLLITYDAEQQAKKITDLQNEIDQYQKIFGDAILQMAQRFGIETPEIADIKKQRLAEKAIDNFLAQYDEEK